jgi:predicted phosphate transport protein (TIGR00153 family)
MPDQRTTLAVRISTSMPINLLRRERRFYDLFDRQAGNVVAASLVLRSAFDDDIRKMAAHAEEIKTLEHAGDELTHKIIQTLNRTFITPFEREDIYALSAGLDDVLDYIDEIAETIILYGITDISPAAKSMASLLVEAVIQVQAAVAKLESKSGITAHGIEVHRIENVGDTESRRAIGELFSGTHDAITIIKLKDFYTLLEDSLDRCEDVANVIEGITIKNA